ncbi:MAG: hypothetical protein ACRC92_19955 [Peptostreptococcaceae bacterium]
MINNEDNAGTSLNIPKDLKIKLEIIAKSDHTSLDSLIISVLDNFVENEFGSDNSIL